jgi:hypothetical protein
MPDDYYVSQYSGEEIDALLGGAGEGTVRYDAAQPLTDAQKQQARANIAAAPDGFGLGGSATLLTSADNLDALMKTGWFYYNTSNAPQGTLPTALAFYATLVHVSAAGNTCMQEAYDPTDSTLHGTVLRRTVYGLGAGAQIYPWEWVNPPMQLGVEYRTTKRYLGKPVYVKVVDCGNLPASGLKNIAHGIANCKPIHVYGEMSNGNTLPYAVGTSYYISADGTYIQIYVTGDLSNQTVKATIKYTKTTD